MRIPLDQGFCATGTRFTLLRCRNLHWLGPVRTTLDLDDELLAEAKALAARERLSLTRLIEQGLALRLRRAAGPPANVLRPSLPVHAGRGGLTAAVADPRSNAALLDAADGLPPP